MEEIQILIALLPILFMVHDFEEIIMFEPWLAKNRAELKRRFPKFYTFLDKKSFSVCPHRHLLLQFQKYLS